MITSFEKPIRIQCENSIKPIPRPLLGSVGLCSCLLGKMLLDRFADYINVCLIHMYSSISIYAYFTIRSYTISQQPGILSKCKRTYNIGNTEDHVIVAPIASSFKDSFHYSLTKPTLLSC